MSTGAADAVARAIHGRRSIGRVAPDPLPRDLVADLVAAAIAAPNHKNTAPWRFVALAGDARREVGAAHARAVARTRPDHPPAGIEKEAALLERAPVVIACAVADSADPVQALEDRDAVAAGVQNLLLLAHARGLAAIWRTGVMPREAEVLEALGFTAGEALVGLVYLGRPLGDPAGVPSPGRPGVDELTVWRGW
ncbi:MAG: nitroreductase [Miltoncostaeaceae bacterium]